MIKSPWQYSTLHDCVCKVLEEQTLWEQRICRVWLPNQDAVVRIPRTALRSLEDVFQPALEASRLSYVAAGAKVAEILEGNSRTSEGPVLLAPMEARVIPLPHQLQALSRAISGDRIRYLLADEVGLGKTIEAGLIMRELKLRGLVRRTLVVAPKGLATQWVAEMRTHFKEQFQLIQGEELSVLQKISLEQQAYWSKNADLSQIKGATNPWTVFEQIIVTLDSIKPLDKRRGWSQEKLQDYNRLRFEELITAGWDLIIVDEAHRLGGSTDQVARYKLGRGLSEAAPYLLLLSATPHQGKSDSFHRLVSLLDRDSFPGPETVSRERVAPFVIRTEKRNAIDATGQPLFKPRRTQMAGIQWETRHHLQKLLYEAVTEYVRSGYNQAMREKKRHIGFLMILMQRLVVSSTRAIRTTLERRFEVLNQSAEKYKSIQLEIEADAIPVGDNSWVSPEEWEDLDGQEQLEILNQLLHAALKNEKAEVQTLLNAARQCEQTGPDAKAEALLHGIYQLQAEENDSDLKVLIFTEFVPTQEMLKDFLEARGISVVRLNGSMTMEERKRVQDDFRENTRILISTDAGGEGLNLQFCHVVFNYDIPWNPMRLEQRIGRVDRIGQPKVVRAINFVFEDSVEFRVREVLEHKLAVILDEFGIDKTGDVLDSAQAGAMFEEVFTKAYLNPEGVAATVEETMVRLREEIRAVRESSAIYTLAETPDLQEATRLRSHPLPHWVEKMTVSYLNSHPGSTTQRSKVTVGAKPLTRRGVKDLWKLCWPEGLEETGSFLQESSAATQYFNLEHQRIRGLALNLPQIAAGQPLPCVFPEGLPVALSGWWGLFELRLQVGQQQQYLRLPGVRKRFFSVFLSEEKKIFLPTARHIWDTLLTTELKINYFLTQEQSEKVFEQLVKTAEQAGQELFEILLQEHQASLSFEEERGILAFTTRRNTLERLGLPEVRNYRLLKCEVEERAWRTELELAKQIIPELRPLLLLRIAKGDFHE
ncbi:MAG: DEAD/DEAH box helicase [SAR324 cluster bacterium]|nr:DEAD/DEAH box helicase [SAR324 cluster bacterium]